MATESSADRDKTKEWFDRYLQLTAEWNQEGLIDLWTDDGVMKSFHRSLDDVPEAVERFYGSLTKAPEPDENGEFRGIEEIRRFFRSRQTEKPFEIVDSDLYISGRSAIMRVVAGFPDGYQIEVLSRYTFNADGELVECTAYRS